ncbi:UNKNOWN [Stylonychia lemnae]|uniref:Uncharacterized protein n=1 Tax=Stylonychia lemnae TaxID=5949 RepID=A0A078ATZ7_STYLE|nr:UNKNOWN [Stylonychia lemnae]|eukprot:CDW85451.1 UNKNOWN [Stylonychia lemnae]
MFSEKPQKPYFVQQSTFGQSHYQQVGPGYESFDYQSSQTNYNQIHNFGQKRVGAPPYIPYQPMPYNQQYHKQQQQVDETQNLIKRQKLFVPLTLRMVTACDPRMDDHCEYEGEIISDIEIIGRILQKINDTQRVILEINDGTSTQKVLFYHKNENEEPPIFRNLHYQQFMYVKIYGTIRVFRDEKAIIGSYIKRIDHYDEVTNHFLRVFTKQEIRKHGPLKSKDLQIDKLSASALALEMNQPAYTSSIKENTSETNNYQDFKSNHQQANNQIELSQRSNYQHPQFNQSNQQQQQNKNYNYSQNNQTWKESAKYQQQQQYQQYKDNQSSSNYQSSGNNQIINANQNKNYNNYKSRSPFQNRFSMTDQYQYSNLKNPNTSSTYNNYTNYIQNQQQTNGENFNPNNSRNNFNQNSNPTLGINKSQNQNAVVNPSLNQNNKQQPPSSNHSNKSSSNYSSQNSFYPPNKQLHQSQSNNQNFYTESAQNQASQYQQYIQEQQNQQISNFQRAEEEKKQKILQEIYTLSKKNKVIKLHEIQLVTSEICDQQSLDYVLQKLVSLNRIKCDISGNQFYLA